MMHGNSNIIVYNICIIFIVLSITGAAGAWRWPLTRF